MERLAIVHATGEVPLGEVSVVIVACAPHRDAAFDAARFAMDETKARAPIWKAERFADGHVWIGQVAQDAYFERMSDEADEHEADERGSPQPGPAPRRGPPSCR